MKLKLILTGATGMVGEGVLHECLQHAGVEAVLVIGRRPCEVQHPKLNELLVGNLADLSEIENNLAGYNACFFCMGVSSVGMKEDAFFKLTYDITLNFAKAVVAKNTDMVFCYISGSGTDSTEKGRMMWARVKGKTENDLMKLPFKNVYNFRPGFLLPTPGLKRTLKYYKYINWAYHLFRKILPEYFSTLKELGLAMIHASATGYNKNIIEVKDIVKLAGQ